AVAPRVHPCVAPCALPGRAGARRRLAPVVGSPARRGVARAGRPRHDPQGRAEGPLARPGCNGVRRAGGRRRQGVRDGPPARRGRQAPQRPVRAQERHPRHRAGRLPRRGDRQTALGVRVRLPVHRQLRRRPAVYAGRRQRPGLRLRHGGAPALPRREYRQGGLGPQADRPADADVGVRRPPAGRRRPGLRARRRPQGHPVRAEQADRRAGVAGDPGEGGRVQPADRPRGGRPAAVDPVVPGRRQRARPGHRQAALDGRAGADEVRGDGRHPGRPPRREARRRAVRLVPVRRGAAAEARQGRGRQPGRQRPVEAGRQVRPDERRDPDADGHAGHPRRARLRARRPRPAPLPGVGHRRPGVGVAGRHHVRPAADELGDHVPHAARPGRGGRPPHPVRQRARRRDRRRPDADGPEGGRPRAPDRPDEHRRPPAGPLEPPGVREQEHLLEERQGTGLLVVREGV
ncbi:MAG: hypothetical protein AVDCRST_MAG64-4415, partial [uncultured Phycisphaerae bacterium]